MTISLAYQNSAILTILALITLEIFAIIQLLVIFVMVSSVILNLNVLANFVGKIKHANIFFQIVTILLKEFTVMDLFVNQTVIAILSLVILEYAKTKNNHY